MSHLKKVASVLFTDHMSPNKNRIKTIKLVNNGFTNVSYLVTNTLDEKYQVRIGNNKINRNNEQLFLAALVKHGGYVYYDPKNGNAIKNWIVGHIPSLTVCRSERFIIAFAKSLKNFQKTPINHNMTKRDFHCFEQLSDFNEIPHVLEKYKSIIKHYATLPLTVGHNDLRPENLIWDNEKVTFIDFEWGTLNNYYWDLGNFLREIKYPIKKLRKMLQQHFPQIDYGTMLDFVFACTCFAYQWTFFPDVNDKLLKYRTNTKKLMLDYYKLIASNIGHHS